MLLGLLGRLRFRAYGTRTPEEVAARLAGRLGRALPTVVRKIQAARAVIDELASVGPSPESLDRATVVLERAGASPESIVRLRETVTILARLGLAPARLELTPGSLELDAANGDSLGLALEPAWTLDSLGAGRVAWGGGVAFRGGRAAVAALALGPLAASAALTLPATRSSSSP